MKQYPSFIIFGPGNYNSLGVLHQLAEAGMEAFLLIVGSGYDRRHGDILRYSRYAGEYHEAPTAACALEWLLANRDRFPQGTILYTTSDEAEKAVDMAYDVLIDQFIFPNAGKQGEVIRLMDKDVQTAIARDAGLTIIPGQYTTAPDFDMDKVEYPCMVKPLNSTTGTKGDMIVCANREELRKATTGRYTKDFVIEKFLEKEAELLLLGVALPNGEVWTPALVHKFDVDPIGDYTHTLVFTDAASHLSDLAAVHKFVQNLGYVGPFSVEFGVEKGKNYFFEINLRNDGTSHYPLRAGVNMAKVYYEAVKGINEHPALIPPRQYYKINEFRDIRRVFYGKISFPKWFSQFRSAGSYRFYHPGDYPLFRALIPMFISFTWSVFRRKVLRR